MTAIAIQPLAMSPRRRARLARTLFVASFTMMVLAGLIFSQGAVATDEPSQGAAAFNYVSVMPGDTLWSLAQEYAGSMAAQDWIAEVILLNNLSGADLVAGEKLALP